MVVDSMAKVLVPEGRFLFFSFSSPRKLLPMILPNQLAVSESGAYDGRRLDGGPWSRIEARRLQSLFLYCFEKTGRDDTDTQPRSASRRSRRWRLDAGKAQ